MTEPLARLEARLCGVERALAEIESRLVPAEDGLSP